MMRDHYSTDTAVWVVAASADAHDIRILDNARRLSSAARRSGAREAARGSEGSGSVVPMRRRRRLVLTAATTWTSRDHYVPRR